MAGRIKNLFSRRSGANTRGAELKASSYESAVPLKSPVKGTYPVAGNGPNILEEYTRGRALGGGRNRLSVSSAAASPNVPRFRGDSQLERPTTAPHSGFPGGVGGPAGHFESYERTRSGFSMTSPPNFSRKPTPEPFQQPKIEKSQRAPSNLRLEAYSHSPERSPYGARKPSGLLTPTALESNHSRNTSSYVDILDAASTIAPGRNSLLNRTRASGRRDYGEDVADRNIIDFGSMDLNSPQFSYLRHVYAQDKGLPAESVSENKRDSSTWNHDMGMYAESETTARTSLNQKPDSSRTPSRQSISRPKTTWRTSSLTSASIKEYGTRPIERVSTAVAHTPTFGSKQGETDGDDIRVAKATTSPPPRSNERSRVVIASSPESIASDSFEQEQAVSPSPAIAQHRSQSRALTSPPPVSQSTDRSQGAMSPPPIKRNESSRPNTSSSPVSGLNSHPIAVSRRRDSLTSTKSYIPTRGTDMEPNNSNAAPNPPRTRDLSRGRTLHRGGGRRSVPVAAAHVPEKTKVVETYTPTPPLPTSSRFARQQILPTPPMSPIPDLSPTTPSPSTIAHSQKTHQPSSRRGSRSHSITYSAFPAIQATRHVKQDSRASTALSEASSSNNNPGATSPIRSSRRDGIIVKGNANTITNGASNPRPHSPSSSLQTRQLRDAPPEDVVDNLTDKTILSPGLIQSRQQIEDAASEIHDRDISPHTIQPEPARNHPSASTTAPLPPPTPVSSPPVSMATNSGWTSYLSMSRRRSSTATSQRSTGSFTSTRSSSSRFTLRPAPFPKSHAATASTSTTKSSSTVRSLSPAPPPIVKLADRRKSTATVSSAPWRHSQAISDEVAASLATLFGRKTAAQHQSQSEIQSRNPYKQYMSGQAARRSQDNQQRSASLRSTLAPPGMMPRLPRLTRNFVDDDAEAEGYVSSSASTTDSAREREQELLFQEGRGDAGFMGMLPGLGWEERELGVPAVEVYGGDGRLVRG